MQSLQRVLLVLKCYIVILACTFKTTHLPLRAIDGLYNRIKRAGKGPRIHYVGTKYVAIHCVDKLAVQMYIYAMVSSIQT